MVTVRHNFKNIQQQQAIFYGNMLKVALVNIFIQNMGQITKHNVDGDTYTDKPQTFCTSIQFSHQRLVEKKKLK